MLSDQELQSLRNLGNESEAAADEIVRLRAIIGTADLPRFLTDVCTAAGLLEHGKRDKGLARRISDIAWQLRRRALGPNA